MVVIVLSTVLMHIDLQIIVPALHLSSQLLVWQLHNLESASAAAAVDRAAGADVKDEEGGSEALLTPQIRNEIRLLSQRIRELVELLTQILRFEFKDVMYEVCIYCSYIPHKPFGSSAVSFKCRR